MPCQLKAAKRWQDLVALCCTVRRDQHFAEQCLPEDVEGAAGGEEGEQKHDGKEVPAKEGGREGRLNCGTPVQAQRVGSQKWRWGRGGRAGNRNSAMAAQHAQPTRSVTALFL